MAPLEAEIGFSFSHPLCPGTHASLHNACRRASQCRHGFNHLSKGPGLKCNTRNASHNAGDPVSACCYTSDTKINFSDEAMRLRAFRTSQPLLKQSFLQTSHADDQLEGTEEDQPQEWQINAIAWPWHMHRGSLRC